MPEQAINTAVEPVAPVEAQSPQVPAPVTAPLAQPLPERAPVDFDDTSYADASDSFVDVADPPAQTQQAAQDAPAAPAAPVAPVAAPDAPAAPPQFSASLLEQAGVTAAEAAVHFGTPENLEKAVRMLDARALQMGQNYLSQYNEVHVPPPQQPAPYAPPAQPQSPAPAAPAAGDPDEFQLPPPSTGGTWDPETVELVRVLDNRYRSQLAARDAILAQQQQTMASFVERQNVSAQHQYIQEFDGFVEGLGDSWKPVLGVGSGHALPPNSILMNNRFHLDNTARAIAAGFTLQGRPVPPRDELWARALSMAFPDIQQQAVRQEVVQQVETRQQQFTARPTHRQSSPMTREDKAGDSAEAWFRARNMGGAVDDFDDSEV